MLSKMLARTMRSVVVERFHRRFILQHLGEAVEIDSAPTGTNSVELAVVFDEPHYACI
jgi:hypothetical protein